MGRRPGRWTHNELVGWLNEVLQLDGLDERSDGLTSIMEASGGCYAVQVLDMILPSGSARLKEVVWGKRAEVMDYEVAGNYRAFQQALQKANIRSSADPVVLAKGKVTAVLEMYQWLRTLYQRPEYLDSAEGYHAKRRRASCKNSNKIRSKTRGIGRQVGKNDGGKSKGGTAHLGSTVPLLGSRPDGGSGHHRFKGSTTFAHPEDGRISGLGRATFGGYTRGDYDTGAWTPQHSSDGERSTMSPSPSPGRAPRLEEGRVEMEEVEVGLSPAANDWEILSDMTSATPRAADASKREQAPQKSARESPRGPQSPTQSRSQLKPAIDVSAEISPADLFLHHPSIPVNSALFSELKALGILDSIKGLLSDGAEAGYGGTEHVVVNAVHLVCSRNGKLLRADKDFGRQHDGHRTRSPSPAPSASLPESRRRSASPAPVLRPSSSIPRAATDTLRGGGMTDIVRPPEIMIEPPYFEADVTAELESGSATTSSNRQQQQLPSAVAGTAVSRADRLVEANRRKKKYEEPVSPESPMSLPNSPPPHSEDFHRKCSNCGRLFREAVLARHQRLCKSGTATSLKKKQPQHQQQVRGSPGKKGAIAKRPGSSTPSPTNSTKWRQQSAELRAAMKAAREANQRQ